MGPHTLSFEQSYFDKLFDLAISNDEKAGDDTFHWMPENAAYTALPRCRNDSEYGFVNGVLTEGEHLTAV